MIIAVTSTVVFEVPDDKIEDAKRKLYEAHLKVIGVPMETIAGPWAWLLAMTSLGACVKPRSRAK